MNLPLPDEWVEELAQKLVPLVAAALAAQEPTREWLSIQEAADYMRCSRQRVYDLRSSGLLPQTRDGTRGILRRTDLDAHLDSEG